MNNRSEIVGLDLGKFIFAIFVITIHVAPFGNNSSLKIINGITQSLCGKIAVPFFFVVAGFLLFQKLNDANQKRRVVIDYIKRVAILYAVWSIIYLPFNIMEFEGKGIKEFILDYTHSFFVVGSYYHLWYLLALIVAVCLVTLLIKCGLDIRIILAISIILFLAGCLTQSWYGLIKPIQSVYPGVWSFLRVMKHFFVTARNGIFEGFVFVTIGAIIALKKISINIKYSSIGFIVSLALIVAEFLVVKKLDLQNTNILYISLLPAAFFAFFVFYNIKIDNVKAGVFLRKMSTIIYLIHMLVFRLSVMILDNYYTNIEESMIMFYIVTFVSILLAFIIVYLSRTKLKILRWLY